MPSKSVKQARFMSAAAHDPAFAAKAGISQSVAEEFHQADAGKKYGAGGEKGHSHNRKKLIAALRGSGR
jgi:hypothetical protein